MNLSLVDLKENPQFVVPEDGKYLVRVERTTNGTVNGKYSSNAYFDCRCKRHFDNKRNVWTNSFDCTGEVTHVSITPVK